MPHSSKLIRSSSPSSASSLSSIRMVTFTPIDGGIRVESSTATFDVFPKKVSKDIWTLQSHPEETLENKKLVSWPGEYDFQSVTMRAIGQEQGKQVSFSAVSDGIRMAFIDAPILDWSDADIEKLGDIDVLVLAGDNPKKITPLIESVDPRVIILFETKDGDLAGSAKACGQSSVTPVGEFKVKPSTLPQDSRQVIVLG